MKVIVTGGRNFTDVNLVREVLSDINPTLIIHGKCKGADTFASEYAEINGIKEKKYPYLSEHGRAGGPIRNKQMIDENKDAMLTGKINQNEIARKYKVHYTTIYDILKGRTWKHLKK